MLRVLPAKQHVSDIGRGAVLSAKQHVNDIGRGAVVSARRCVTDIGCFVLSTKQYITDIVLFAKQRVFT